MVKKSEIVSYIHSAAKADGKQPGRDRFEKPTGIKRPEWDGLHWAKWGDALKDAGLCQTSFKANLEAKLFRQPLSALPKNLDLYQAKATFGLRVGVTQRFPRTQR